MAAIIVSTHRTRPSALEMDTKFLQGFKTSWIHSPSRFPPRASVCAINMVFITLVIARRQSFSEHTPVRLTVSTSFLHHFKLN